MYHIGEVLAKAFTWNYYLFLVLFWVLFVPVVFLYGAISTTLEMLRDNKLDRKSYERYRKEFWK